MQKLIVMILVILLVPLPQNAMAISVYGLNFAGPEGLTRKQAKLVTDIGNEEWNNTFSKKLVLKNFRSKSKERFSYPTTKNWYKQLGRVNAYIRRHLRHGKKGVYVVYMPIIWNGSGFYYAGLAWSGAFKRFPEDSTVLVFGREYGNTGKYRIPLIAKVYQHEMGHNICGLKHSNYTSCMMTDRFIPEALPIWCPKDVDTCEKTFETWSKNK